MKAQLLFVDVMEVTDTVFTLHGKGKIAKIKSPGGHLKNLMYLVQHDAANERNVGNQPIWFTPSQISLSAPLLPDHTVDMKV